MIIRFGYVASALALWDCSPSKTITFTRWQTLPKEEQLEKLCSITKENLNHTIRILYYNIAHGITLYRFSSAMIPLATHAEVDFPFADIFAEELQEIGNIVKKYELRVSFHPNQFTLFTSDKAHITANAIKDMEYHYTILAAMGIAENSYVNIHVGGAYVNKPEALQRFYENLSGLPPAVKRQMTLENDDKTYTVSETLAVCQKETIPMMLDYHHHIANPTEEPLESFLPAIFNTWSHTGLAPKVHLSSPKDEKQFRSHADFVNLAFIQPFLDMTRSLGQDFDVMLESKKKDASLLQLMEDISKLRGYTRIDGAAFHVK